MHHRPANFSIRKVVLNLADDLSGYKDKMDFCLNLANKGALNSNNGYYVYLKEKSKNMPDLARWLAREIDTKVNQV